MTVPIARAPLPVTRPPGRALPVGACDSHVHLFSASHEFARLPDRAEDPAPADLAAWSRRLLDRMATLGLTRAVLVHSVIHGTDNAQTMAAMTGLGGEFRAVALVEPDVSDATLDELHAAGFRGVRLDLVFPGPLNAANVHALLPRLAERGWHLQVFGRWADHQSAFRALVEATPCPIVLDHFAYAPQGGVFRSFLELAANDRIWIKLSSLYRQDPATLAPFLNAVEQVAPHRVLWGSNWPHVRWEGAMPDDTDLIDMVLDTFDEEAVKRLLVDNPARLYDFPGVPDS